jgi:excisionase family DNA binding protein
MTSIPTLSLVSEAAPTLDPKEPELTPLEQELADDVAYTAGQVRHIPPSPSGSSRNPNHILTFNFVNDHFLNREAHEEAVAIVEGWKPQPWKGQIWRGAGKDNIERVWIGPVHFDLVFDGREWLPCNTSHSSSVDPGAVDFNLPIAGVREVTVGYELIAGWGARRAKAITIPSEAGESTAPVKKPKTLYDASRRKAEKELNAAYVQYEKDPAGQKESFYMTLSAYVRGVRSNAIYLELSERAEMHIDAGDILGAFLLKITSLIENGKYTHQGKMENWLGYHWGNYHLPEMQTEIKSYLDRITYVNQTDVGGGDDDEDKEHQIHSVAIVDVEEQQVRREQEGYCFPVSRDRIFRQLNKPTQAIVEMLARGLRISDIAMKLDISPRQLRRRVDAAEDGEAALNNVLHTLQACVDEDNLMEWPEQGIDIQACAAPSENKLAAMVEAYETAITAAQLATILQCSRREIYKLIDEKRIPALRVGTMIRLDPYQIAEWIRSKMTIAA